jgi:sigma-E factor negative regulatory protein RseC
MNGKIDHIGIIEQIDGNHIKVRIVQSSACSLCQAKSICSSSESKEKIVDINSSESTMYSIGESVKVCATETMGRNAIILAFVTPLILMVIWIIASSSLFSISELLSACGAILILTLYYIILSMNKKKISKQFSFWIEKL